MIKNKNNKHMKGGHMSIALLYNNFQLLIEIDVLYSNPLINHC